jgi:hypothetical protein
MSGKKISAYLAFQKPVLVALAAVGLARLVLSVAGVPDKVVVWCSMNLVGWIGALWYGVAAHRRGFGTYRHLLPLAVFQMALFHAIAVVGILLAIAGWSNIYAAPEFSGPAAQDQWVHLAAHLTVGMVAGSLVTWAGSCLAMLAARKVAPRATAAPSAA